MESINGWIKAELFTDFHVTGEKTVEQEIDEYIAFFNEERPAYKLGKNAGKRSIWFNGNRKDKKTGIKKEYCKKQFEKYIAADFSRFH